MMKKTIVQILQMSHKTTKNVFQNFQIKKRIGLFDVWNRSAYILQRRKEPFNSITRWIYK